MVSLRRELQCVRAFGSDGEKALVDAFVHEFRFAIHLFCSIHARRNIKKNLRERRFPENVVNEITDDIFGKQVGSTYCEGLVDVESEEVLKGLKKNKYKGKREKRNALAVLQDFMIGFVSISVTQLLQEC